MLQHVVHQNLVDIVGTGILVGDIQLCGIDPAFRNTGINILTQTDLVILPRLIALAVLVDPVFLDDPDRRIRQPVIDVGHVGHHILRKILHHGRMIAHELITQTFQDLFSRRGINGLDLALNVCGILRSHVT